MAATAEDRKAKRDAAAADPMMNVRRDGVLMVGDLMRAAACDRTADDGERSIAASPTEEKLEGNSE